MSCCGTKNYYSPQKKWILLLHTAEIRRKTQVRQPYCNLYAYGANNPVRYIDPDGRQGMPSLSLQDMWNVISRVDPMAKLFNLFNAAGNGDVSAQNALKYITREVGRDMLQQVSDVSSNASLVFLCVGAPEATAITSTIGLICDGVLAVDTFLNEDKVKGVVDSLFIVAGVVAGKTVGKALDNVVDKGLCISIGKNGLYYSLGRSGAMKTWEATKALIQADIASSVFGDIAPELASRIISEAKKAYDALQE